MKLLILAAGKGRRLDCEKTQLPKVMRQALGKPLLQYVLESAGFIPREDICAIVGFCKEAVMDAFPGISFAVQEEQKGTGHAVMCAREALSGYSGPIMVVNGDMPLFSEKTLRRIAEAHTENGAACTLASYIAEGDIPPYGRIVREGGCVKDIVEEKDATEEQKLIRELNAGLYVFDSESLCTALENMEKSPVSGEYYITNAPKLLCKMGLKTLPYVLDDPSETLGVNTEEDLAAVEELLRTRGV